MRLTKLEIAEQGLNPKAWAAAMQRAAREPGAPAFALKGPVSLPVRKRRPPTSTVATTTANWPFMGGERFRISGLAVDSMAREDALTITVQLQPAEPELAAEISGMSLLLSEAIEHLEGLEDFANNHYAANQLASAAPKPKTMRERTEAAREDNPLYGAW